MNVEIRMMLMSWKTNRNHTFIYAFNKSFTSNYYYFNIHHFRVLFKKNFSFSSFLNFLLFSSHIFLKTIHLLGSCPHELFFSVSVKCVVNLCRQLNPHANDLWFLPFGDKIQRQLKQQLREFFHRLHTTNHLIADYCVIQCDVSGIIFQIKFKLL